MAHNRLLATSVPALLLLLIAGSIGVHATERDTLRFFDPTSASAYYRDQNITAQGARFDLPAPGYLRRLVLWFGGDAATGSAHVTVYGNSGGLPAPLLRTPVSRTYVVSKERRGMEKIVVELDDDLFIVSPQFFVVVENITPGMWLLSDRRTKLPRCATLDERWQYQVLRKSDGTWYNGAYGYAVEADVEYPKYSSPAYLADVTRDLELPDSVAHNGCISWGDFDSDGWSDVLVGERLYRNLHGGRFEDVTYVLGDIAGARAHLFTDMDNDGDLDIVVLAVHSDNDMPGHVLLLNDGHGAFDRRILNLSDVTEPSTVAIADANADGYLDMFIGEAVDGGKGGRLFLNTGSLDFGVDRSFVDSARVIGAQWVDVEGDGDLDLYVAADDAAGNALWISDGQGKFSRSTLGGRSRVDQQSDGAGTSGAADWGDYNNDGTPELLQPVTLSRGVLATEQDGGMPLFERLNGGEPDLQAVDGPEGYTYEHWSGAATWADVDNDGRLDALFTSACDCRYASLYLRDPAGGFANGSFEYGLFRTVAGTDAVWVDFDNDGRLDLATFIGGRFRLFRNTAHVTNNYVDIDVTGGADPAGLLSGGIDVWVSGRKVTQQVVSGRGRLMQAPLRVHFGLGDEREIDSIVIRWNDRSGSRHTIRRPDINHLYRLVDENSVQEAPATTDIELRVTPNPFTDRLTFRYALPSSMRVRIEVHALDGALVSVPLDETLDGGPHSLTWTPVDKDGRRLPPGTYIYRVLCGATQLVGRATLVH